ncbi:MAG: M1 family metallopeptidase, partial [Rhodothermia bacterium]|nr:M1 family metallopeptidase [Rhodothermia bacterium]
MPEQASYDVSFYDLDLEVSPSDSTIDGRVEVHARVGSPLEWLVLDLVPELEVRGTQIRRQDGWEPATYSRLGGKIWIRLPRTFQPEETVVASVAYGGRPRVARNAPWDGGFSWDTTSTGAPWIATTCQGEGADLWWPVKDHVSDEPDSMSITVTVPDPLVVASNGRLRATRTSDTGKTTFEWFVSNPINTYAVALNIAAYRLIEGEIESIAGDTFPVQFFVLEEDYDRGAAFFPEILDHVRWFEGRFGPYPFRSDKYGVAQTPHLGMEHQSIIAYGADFNPNVFIQRDFGFDQLHHHELAHEWWGNLVTNADWKDAWLHEGIGTYT